jgi:hypothetical protein
MWIPSIGTRRTVLGRSGAVVVVLLSALVVALVACTTSSGDGNADASAVERSLGAVPVPSAPSAQPTPTGSAGHPAVLAIGGPVRVDLADGRAGVITVLGPEQLDPSIDASGQQAKSTRAVISVRITAIRGAIELSGHDLTSRDETGTAVALTARGASSVRATAGQSATIALQGRFDSGAAQITWRTGGQVYAIWTFTIELD